MSSTLAPNDLKRSAAARTLASTSGSELRWPKPSFNTPMRSPLTPPPSASV